MKTNKLKTKLNINKLQIARLYDLDIIRGGSEYYTTSQTTHTTTDPTTISTK